MRIDPRIQILYLLAVGTLAFVTSHPTWLLGLLGLQVALWFAAGLSPGGLLEVLRKLLVFFAFIVLSYAFFAPEAGDRYAAVPVLAWQIQINLSGILRGLLLSSRIVTVIYASQIIQRTGEGTALVRGLRGLFVPASIAYSLDMVLALLGPEQQHHRPGSGEGRQRKEQQQHEVEPEERTFDVVRRMVRGDVGFLVDRTLRNISRARERAESYGLRPELVSDLAVITGLAAVSMTLRALHVLPGIPFAPGHKGVLFLPFYILAYNLTSSRWGATKLGIVIGVVSFLTGEGKFGVFEIFRHIAPGIFIDLVMPVVYKVRPEPGSLVYALIGVGAALTRLSTLLLVAYFVEAPSVFYAFLLPAAISHSAFGFLSGFVTFHLMKSVQKLKSAL